MRVHFAIEKTALKSWKGLIDAHLLHFSHNNSTVHFSFTVISTENPFHWSYVWCTFWWWCNRQLSPQKSSTSAVWMSFVHCVLLTRSQGQVVDPIKKHKWGFSDWMRKQDVLFSLWTVLLCEVKRPFLSIVLVKTFPWYPYSDLFCPQGFVGGVTGIVTKPVEGTSMSFQLLVCCLASMCCLQPGKCIECSAVPRCEITQPVHFQTLYLLKSGESETLFFSLMVALTLIPHKAYNQVTCNKTSMR